MKRSEKIEHSRSKSNRAQFLPIGLLIALTAFACMPASAQQANLALASGSAKPGGAVALALALGNTTAAQPGSLEWTMSYSASDISGVSVAVSSSASVAHKAVSCNSSSGSTICVLSGLDENTIAAGSVATATFQIASNSQSTSIPIQLSGMAAADDGSLLPLSSIGGTVTSSGSGSGQPSPSFSATSISIWAPSALPDTVTVSDANAVELGMKFRSDVTGMVTGMRFYKGPQNTGIHLGHLWSSNGTLLAKLTFQNETPSGWQQALFATPVSIQANMTYVVSYYAPAGFYSANDNFFTAALNTPPLHALQSGADGPNGVYVYGASAFPGQSWNDSNYWVDVLFVPSTATAPSVPASAAAMSVWTPAAVPGTITASDGSSVELGMKFRSDVAGQVSGVRFYKGPQNTRTHTGHLWNSSGALLGAVTFQNESASGWQQANFANPVSIQANTTYVISYYAPQGHYSFDKGCFSSAVNAPPLHALQNGADGSNGVYSYGSGGFPNQSWNAGNYWVDAVFTPKQ